MEKRSSDMEDLLENNTSECREKGQNFGGKDRDCAIGGTGQI